MPQITGALLSIEKHDHDYNLAYLKQILPNRKTQYPAKISTEISTLFNKLCSIEDHQRKGKAYNIQCALASPSNCDSGRHASSFGEAQRSVYMAHAREGRRAFLRTERHLRNAF